MSERPFLAARIEEAINRKVEAALRLVRWRECIIPYVGYGSTKQVRVMGRVVMRQPPDHATVVGEIETALARRGWRNFVSVGCVNVPVRIRVGEKFSTVWTDRGGYIDSRLEAHGLEPGWHEIEIFSRTSERTTVRVLIVADEQKFGIVSDIDDTVITTWLPRLLIAAYNSFWLREGARQPVEGMAELYRKMLADRPGAPVVYVSTGSYDTFPFLNRFLRQNGYPEGPLLLTDWGPTNTGWFRSGQDHKRSSLRELSQDFPKIKWVLVGDDGQHDPQIYSDFASYLPKKVRAIAIRQLSEAEHTLAHGTPTELPGQRPSEAPDSVTEVRAPNGHLLWALLKPVLARKKKQDDSAPDAPATSQIPAEVPLTAEGAVVPHLEETPPSDG